MCKILDTLAFNALMVFLMIGGFVNSVVAILTTCLIGAFGMTGNILGVAYFGYKSYKAWKEGK